MLQKPQNKIRDSVIATRLPVGRGRSLWQFSPLFLLFFVVFALCFFLLPGNFVQAQEIDDADKNLSPAPASSYYVIADVNIFNQKLISQDGKEIKISFDLNNKKGAQGQIRYGVEISKKIKDDFFVFGDKKVYDEVLSLPENSSVSKTVTYAIPQNFSGDYRVSVFSQNSNGLMLAAAFVADIKLQGEEKGVNILPETCFLRVEGEETKYYPTQGVDIKPEENLLAFCDGVNETDAKISLTANFEIYKRSLAGEKLQLEYNEPQVVVFEPAEKKQFSLKLPKVTVPQAYDVRLAFEGGNGQITNPVIFHYVMRGQSATIQNVILDKDYYSEGDVANLDIFWTLSADSFEDSRFKEGTEIGAIRGIIELVDGNNKACAEKKIEDLTSKMRDFKTGFFLPVTKACADPKVLVSFLGEGDKIFDQQDFSVKSKGTNYLPAFFVIVAVVLLGIIFWRKRVNKVNQAALLFAFLILLVPSDTFAKTFSLPVSSHGNPLVWTVDGLKDSYTPGETIYLSGTMLNGDNGCNNAGVYANTVVTIRDASEVDPTIRVCHDMRGYRCSRGGIGGGGCYGDSFFYVEKVGDCPNDPAFHVHVNKAPAEFPDINPSLIDLGSGSVPLLFEKEPYSDRLVPRKWTELVPPSAGYGVGTYYKSITAPSKPGRYELIVGSNWVDGGGYGLIYQNGTSVYVSGLSAGGNGAVGVIPFTVTQSICTSWTYTDWGSCQKDNYKYRTVTGSYPNGCMGNPPASELKKACIYNTPPKKPTIEGVNTDVRKTPDIGYTNTPYVFRVVATDAETSNKLQYKYGASDDKRGGTAFVTQGTEQKLNLSWSTVGVKTIEVFAVDENGASSEKATYTITIKPGNRAPQITEVKGTKSGTSNTYNFDIKGTDPDQDAIRYGIDWDRDGKIDEWIGVSDTVSTIYRGDFASASYGANPISYYDVMVFDVWLKLSQRNISPTQLLAKIKEEFPGFSGTVKRVPKVFYDDFDGNGVLNYKDFAILYAYNSAVEFFERNVTKEEVIAYANQLDPASAPFTIKNMPRDSVSGQTPEFFTPGTTKTTPKKQFNFLAPAQKRSSIDSPLGFLGDLFGIKMAEAQTSSGASTSFDVYAEDANGLLSSPYTYTVSLSDPTAFTPIDIGLRMNIGTPSAPNIIKLLAEPKGQVTSPLRIAKDGTVYGIILITP